MSENNIIFYKTDTKDKIHNMDDVIEDIYFGYNLNMDAEKKYYKRSLRRLIKYRLS